MRTYSIPLGSFAGVQLRLHWVFVLFAVFLTTQTIGLGMWARRGLALAALALATVFLHELGHMVVASVTRARLRLILLLPLGGVSFYAPRKVRDGEEQRFLTQRQENAIALAGPFTSLLVAAIGIGILAAVRPDINIWQWPFIRGSNLPKAFVWFNLLLGVINILPAYPLDFGRILRAHFAHTRSHVDATAAAVGLSRAIAIGLTVVGFLQQQNVWVLLVGFFIFVAAQLEDRSLAFHSVTESVKIEEVMLTDFSTLSTADTLEDALYKAVHTLQDDFPVIRSGDLVGTITRQRIAETLNSNGNGYVQSAMSKIVEVARKNETLGAAFRKLQARGTTLIPVVDDDRLVGIVTLQNLMHSLGLLVEQRKRTGVPQNEQR
ncbi:MAG: site-2 protease family protein [Acidobacteriaceae bacterium]